MAEERLDIEVTDGVDASIPKKFRDIASAAERASSSLDKLKKAMQGLNRSSVDKLAAAMAKADSAQAKLISAQARLTNAQNAGAVSANKAALAQQRVATEAARTQAAQSQAAAAAARAQQAADRLAASQARLANSTNSVGTAAKKAAADVTTLGAKSGTVASGLDRSEVSVRRFTASTRQMNHANANIIAQLQDIGVSLAGGQNPFTVLIQQGSQLDYVARTMEGGWKALSIQILKILKPVGLLGLAFSPLIASFGLFQRYIKQGIDTTKIVNSLGLTRKEIKKLENTTVTSGDIMKAMWQVALEEMANSLGINMEDMKKTMKNGMDSLVSIARVGAAGIMAIFAGTRDYLGELEKGGAWGLITGKSFDGLVEKTYGKQYDEYYNWLGEMGEKIKARVIKNKTEELQAQAREIKLDRTPRKGSTAESPEVKRAREIAKLNLELDNEMKRMKMLQKEREVQTRMDSIEESLMGKKITLNDTERQTIEDKVRAIQEYNAVQQQSDQIMQELRGPTEEMIARIDAATDLYEQQKISLKELENIRGMATRKEQEALDPLYRLRQEMNLAEATMGKYGLALEQANYYEQIRQEHLNKGIPINEKYVKGLDTEIDRLMERNRQLQIERMLRGVLPGQLGPKDENQQILDNKQALYDKLNELADKQAWSDKRRAYAKMALEGEILKAQMAQYDGFFNGLNDLASSGFKGLFLLTKGWAIAQAAVNGAVALSNALALPFPASIAYWGTVLSSMASIISTIKGTNMGGFQHGGSFIVGGKDGVDNNRIMMDVSKGERVTVETVNQQRKGNGANVAIYNYASNTAIDQEVDSQGNIRVMIQDEIRKQVPRINEEQFSDPNSRTSRAAQRSFGLTRRRT